MDVCREIVNLKSTKNPFSVAKVVHKTYDTTYVELLSMNSDVSIHLRHLRFLVTELFKSVNNLNPHFMRNYFKGRKYIAPSSGTLNLPWNKFTLIRGSLLWNNIPREIEESLSTEELKKRLMEHRALPCSCVVRISDIC